MAGTAAAAAAGTTVSLHHHHHHHNHNHFQPLSLSQSFLPFKTPLKPSIKLKFLSPQPTRRLTRISISYYPHQEEEEEIDVDSDKPREECGVVGIIGDPDSARIACLALHALQHRGQEGAGIASSNAGLLRCHTGLGLVSDVFRDPSTLSSLPGPSSIGHVRYSTAGAASSPLNVQPFTAGYRFGHLAVAHNGNIVNYSSLRSQLESSGSIFNTSSDTEVVLHLIAHSKSRPFVARLVDACHSLHGAYSFLFLTHDNKLFAVRDPYGFRPLVMGRRRTNNAVVFASETCALDLVDAEYIREVNPGEIVEVDGNNNNAISTLCLMPPRQRKACIFEHIYFALPNSIVFGHAVHSSREAFGKTLAAESPVPGADVVIPVPDSGFFAALGYAKHSGVQFQQGLIRSHYVTRTFIQPSQKLRDLAVKMKLAPVRGILEGKVVVVVDDSIVRGTTSSKIVRLIKNAGAKEVHMRIACPPIVGSCYYGVDTPSSEELISNRMDVEGLRKEIGCDSLAFLSLDSLRRLLGDEAPMFCDACFSKNYPVPPIENEVEMEDAVLPIESEVERADVVLPIESEVERADTVLLMEREVESADAVLPIENEVEKAAAVLLIENEVETVPLIGRAEV